MSLYFHSACPLMATTTSSSTNLAPRAHKCVSLIHVLQVPNMSAIDTSSGTVISLYFTSLLLYDIIIILCLNGFMLFQLVLFIPGVYYLLYPSPFGSWAILYVPFSLPSQLGLPVHSLVHLLLCSCPALSSSFYSHLSSISPHSVFLWPMLFVPLGSLLSLWYPDWSPFCRLVWFVPLVVVYWSTLPPPHPFHCITSLQTHFSQFSTRTNTSCLYLRVW